MAAVAVTAVLAGGAAAVWLATKNDERLAAPPELGDEGAWAAPNGDLAATRAAAESTIDSRNVGRLARAWRFRVSEPTTFSGLLSGAMLVLDEHVYVQTLNSNVYALDARTGRVAGGGRSTARAAARTGSRPAGAGSSATPTRARSRSTGGPGGRLAHAPDDRTAADHVAPAATGGIVFTSSTRPSRRVARASSTRSTRTTGASLAVRDGARSVDAPEGGLGRWGLVDAERRRGRRPLRGHGEPAALGRHAGRAERRRLPRQGALHRLAARARRTERQARVVRPGHPARRARLRLRPAADPRAAGVGGRERELVFGARQGRPRDRLGPHDAAPPLESRPSART